MENLEEDVAALIEASGAKEVVLVGHDWGALIAWYYAMFGRLPISKLIIMNVPHPPLRDGVCARAGSWRSPGTYFSSSYPGSRSGGWHVEVARRSDAYFATWPSTRRRFPDEVLRVYREAAARPGALTAMLNYYRALIRGYRRTSRRGTVRIDVPTLMIWGEVDAALGKELTYGTEKYVSNLTLRYLPNVSHWVQQEAPETVNAMIEAWLTDAACRTRRAPRRYLEYAAANPSIGQRRQLIGRLEAKYLAIERQFCLLRIDDGLRLAKAMALALIENVGHRHVPGAQCVDDALRLIRRNDRVVRALQDEYGNLESIEMIQGRAAVVDRLRLGSGPINESI